MSTYPTGRTVVAGVDGSDSALDAVRWAAHEAVRRRVPLRLVHAFAWPHGRHIGEPRLGDYHTIMLNAARAMVATAANVAREVEPDAEIEEQVIVGFPVPVLESESERAQVLVVGNRGLGGITGLFVGSVATTLAARSACPLVVVRGLSRAEELTTRPVVVGVDGTPNSEGAIAFAFEAAAARRVPLVAVHAWWDLLLDPTVAPMVDFDAFASEEAEVLSERLAGWTEKYPDVPVERVLARDRPAHQLVKQAERAQLVVVGTRGRGALAGLVLGSVSHALLHSSPCPVAVVRSKRDSTER